MASIKEKELKKELEIALDEIGEIKPWFDKDFNCWLFFHPLYPVECEGKSAEEVIKKYPKYIKVFIEHRMQGMIDEVNEKKTKGKGGYRPGAGRPKGSIGEPKRQIRVPNDIADWLNIPGVISNIQQMLRAYKG